jgi:hypothetical protein
VDLIREHQFGRIENMSVRAGQPILDRELKVVRVARLGGERGPNVPGADEFELKQSVRDLFEELARLGNGIVVRLDFRHGLPFLMETAIPTKRDEQPDLSSDQNASRSPIHPWLR